ncbi:MAG: SIS domain-containing protein [Sulfuricellaceae bacterium]
MVSFAVAPRASELQTILDTAVLTDAFGRVLDTEAALEDLKTGLVERGRSGKGVYLVGNGGSAAVASHAITDFVNVAKLRAMTLHESSLMTCMANDYGYENAFSRILGVMADAGDVLLAISSSGRSANIRNAVAKMKDLGGMSVTLSGFDGDNPLRQMGDLNIWLNSHDYGLVEIGHLFILHNIADRIHLPKLA